MVYMTKAATQGYTLLIQTNAFGEAIPEIVLLTSALILQLALLPSLIRRLKLSYGSEDRKRR